MKATTPTAANQSASGKKKSKGREALGWIVAIAAAVAAAFLIRAFLFEFIVVDGPSMNPTLETGERLGVEKVSRYGSLPERGDIVIVHYPRRTENFVKRVVGLPGETVQVIDSTVYINGAPIAEDYTNTLPYADFGPVVVPEDEIFVMGDNRSNSTDSRAIQVGTIPRDAIVGRAMFIAWPPDRIQGIPGESYGLSEDT